MFRGWESVDGLAAMVPQIILAGLFLVAALALLFPKKRPAPAGAGGTMDSRPERDFVYTTYIAAPPEKLWQALTEPAYTRLYFFGMEFDSDWRPQSELLAAGSDGVKKRWGQVLRYEAPKVLAYTFDGPAHGQAPGRPTVATFELQPHGGGTKLTLTHSQLQAQDLDPRRDTFAGLNNGWPAILSSLKSLMETGRPYEFLPADEKGNYLKK
jgi:uncharacterized protein YndB with AHSA1/START domain